MRMSRTVSARSDVRRRRSTRNVRSHSRGKTPEVGMDFDVVIRGGTVIDGTGAPARRADVGIVGDRVAAVDPSISGRGTTEIDATDRVVTPGFVDIHTH